MELFKKIFDLEPEAVEEFIKKQINPDCLTDDCYLKIDWGVKYNEFLVEEEPKLSTKDYKTWKYQGKKLSLGDYFKFGWNHWHFTFQEIYGKMTGETVFNEEISFDGKDLEKYDLMYSFFYNKKEVIVCHLITGEWCIREYIKDAYHDDIYHEVTKPVPKDLMKAVLEVYNKDTL